MLYSVVIAVSVLLGCYQTVPSCLFGLNLDFHEKAPQSVREASHMKDTPIAQTPLARNPRCRTHFALSDNVQRIASQKQRRRLGRMHSTGGTQVGSEKHGKFCGEQPMDMTER